MHASGFLAFFNALTCHSLRPCLSSRGNTVPDFEDVAECRKEMSQKIITQITSFYAMIPLK
jgi:hypothetical protein